MLFEKGLKQFFVLFCRAFLGWGGGLYAIFLAYILSFSGIRDQMVDYISLI